MAGSTDVGIVDAPKGYISLEEHHGVWISLLQILILGTKLLTNEITIVLKVAFNG